MPTSDMDTQGRRTVRHHLCTPVVTAAKAELVAGNKESLKDDNSFRYTSDHKFIIFHYIVFI